MNFYRYRYPLALCLAAALSLSTPGLTEAKDKGKGKGDGRGGSSKVVKRSGGDRGDRGRERVARSSSRGPSQRIARGASPRRSDNRPKIDRSPKSKPIPTTQFASRSVKRDSDRDRAIRTSRVQRDTDRRVAVRDTDRRPSVQRRDHDHDRNRDRSRYSRRHDHHSHDWFHTHGWWYDRDYWYSHRLHRYYNDTLGVYIINPTGPSYGDGYSDYYGFDYETRVAVQQSLAEMGYYNGPIDGVIGSGTRAAIARYQSDYGLPVSGQIDTSLMQSLRLM